MNPFESSIRTKIEGQEQNDVIDSLLHEFPEELQDIHEDAIEEIDDDQGKADYLLNKLIQRKEALVEWSTEELSKMIAVSHEIPKVVLNSLEESKENEATKPLGFGKNGEVYASISQPQACYKVLKMDRVQNLGLSIVRESSMQYQVGELVKDLDGGACVPQVLGFVEHPEVLAMLMEKVDGCSIRDILEEKEVLPEGFNSDSFFEKIEKTLTVMNEHGYFHRDLVDNAGNIMVDAKGDPWIVDFGSTIKATNYLEHNDSHSYQLRPGGIEYAANDIDGIRGLRKRLETFLSKQN